MQTRFRKIFDAAVDSNAADNEQGVHIDLKNHASPEHA